MLIRCLCLLLAGFALMGCQKTAGLFAPPTPTPEPVPVATPKPTPKPGAWMRDPNRGNPLEKKAVRQ